MQFVTAETLRGMDQAAIESGTPGVVLMNRAGRAIAEHLRSLSPRGVLFLAGRGNNGGDAYAAACYLHQIGIYCKVWIAAWEDEVTGDAQVYFEQMKRAGVHVSWLSEEADWNPDGLKLPLVDIVVDCLLGTGSKGAPGGVIGAAVRFANRLPPGLRTVAVDLPTGLDADRGEVHDPCVRADLTLSLALPKTGFLTPAARDVTGSIECLDIGLGPAPGPDAGEDSHPQLIGPPTPRRRVRDTHKGSYGRVLCVGGARGYTGAIGLAARAALRAGAGTVTVVTADSVAPVVASICPEAMVHGLEETDTGSLSAEGWDRVESGLRAYDAILAGPGMTTHNDTLQIVRRILREAECPLVFDADALNIFAARAHWFAKASGPAVLTPHPGELARLLGGDAPASTEERLAAARELASMANAVTVLKGSGTLVVEKEEAAINLNGNPGMATAGTGDVLAGLTVGLLAQGVPPGEAAREAVYRHGRAGDLAAWHRGEAAMVAGDLLSFL